MMRAPGPPAPPPGATLADWEAWRVKRDQWRKAEERALIWFGVYLALTTAVMLGSLWFAWWKSLL